ncbi:uncharacterized protein LOC142230841 [Haematobia irritans]|uniref:uncharacterized protein LOC142230841 n=1 Tax=Haematobia irritans TaxID=7368 RepID=UPI003F4FD0F8
MPWTWFVALKIHFYIMSCLLMLLLQLQFYYAIVMGASIVLFSAVAAIIWIWGITHRYGYSTTLLYELTHFNLVSDNICLFIVPYILGVYLGHLIHRANHNIRMHIVAFATGWILVISLLVFYFYGTQFVILQLGKWLKASLTVITHLVWNFIIFWIIVTALSNNGDFINKFLSFKYASALEKLTPINVLIAPIIIRLILFTGDVPIYWSTGQIIAMFMGCLLASHICSLVLYVLLDGPLMAALESLLTIHRA